MKTIADLKMIIILLLISTICSEMCKYRYTCEENLDESKCAEKVNLVGATEFKLKTCSDKKQYCPFLSLVDGQESVSCTTEAKLPSYPGGYCSKDEDCINGIVCDKANFKCIGLADSEICSEHSQCNIGSACIKLDEFTSWCMKQKKVGESCNNSFECENMAGCGIIGGDKKCIAFFSVRNGLVIEDPVDFAEFNKENNEVFVSFCMSGFKDKDNICRNFMLREEPTGKTCQKDEDCYYNTQTISEYANNFGEIVNLEHKNDLFLKKTNNGEQVFSGACDCSYNLKGDRRCREANIHEDGSKIFTDFLNELTIFLTNPKCHTIERFNCKDNRKDPQTYIVHKKNEVFALYSHRLKDAEECISEVIFPFLDRKPKKCPKIVCDNTLVNTCINAVNSLKNNRTVKVNPCFDSGVCFYNYKGIFNINTNYEASCSQKETKINNFPGEPCKTNDNCMKISIEIEGKRTEISECLENSQRCRGAKVNETCYDHSSCNVGLFCDKTDEKRYICKPQKAVNSSCRSSFECKNDLICNGLCIIPFSLEIGDNTNKVDDVFKNYACKTRYLHSNGICGSITSNQSTVSGGPVECDYEEHCEYSVVISKDKNANEQISKECECGFNKDGKGYCPKAVNDVDTQPITDKVNQLQKESLRNLHHTLTRFSGINDGKHNFKCFEYYLNNRFYNAESCVKEALNFKLCGELIESNPFKYTFLLEDQIEKN